MKKVKCTCSCQDKPEGDFLKDCHGCSCDLYQARHELIYPELTGNQIRGKKKHPVEYPDKCPACGAEKVSEKEFIIGTDRFPTRIYGCGGKYETKPQIQNHTDYFWGSCGKLKDIEVEW
jgi:hypothetical protein